MLLECQPGGQAPSAVWGLLTEFELDPKGSGKALKSWFEVEG